MKAKNNQSFVLISIVTILAILALWFFSYFMLKDLPEGQRGSFGDMFGAINALYSGLALAGIILSIMLQRSELKETREEFKIENELLKSQQFESTFFNLLQNQQQITNNLKSSITNISGLTNTSVSGYFAREVFFSAKLEIARIISALKSDKYDTYSQGDFADINPETGDVSEDEKFRKLSINSYTVLYYGITKEDWLRSKHPNSKQTCKLAYSYFIIKFHSVLGHYFRHLYYILKFIEKQEKSEYEEITIEQNRKKYNNYAQFIQAQMSTNELMLLYYHCLIYPNMQKLCIKYRILHNIAIDDLVEPDHHVIHGIDLKTRRSILD